MIKEKIVSLRKYIADTEAKISGPLPSKHIDNADSYHTFLRLEVKKTKAKIDAVELDDKK